MASAGADVNDFAGRRIGEAQRTDAANSCLPSSVPRNNSSPVLDQRASRPPLHDELHAGARERGEDDDSAFSLLILPRVLLLNEPSE